MKIFLDSSSLVKRYIEESGTREVNSLFHQADEIFVSIIAFPEVISALSRNKNEKKLSLEQFNERKKELLVDFEDFQVCDLTPEVIRQTVDLIEKYSLRTLDAIHLAGCLAVETDCFVSSDSQQMKAAKALKLKILHV